VKSTRESGVPEDPGATAHHAIDGSDLGGGLVPGHQGGPIRFGDPGAHGVQVGESRPVDVQRRPVQGAIQPDQREIGLVDPVAGGGDGHHLAATGGIRAVFADGGKEQGNVPAGRAGVLLPGRQAMPVGHGEIPADQERGALGGNLLAGIGIGPQPDGLRTILEGTAGDGKGRPEGRFGLDRDECQKEERRDHRRKPTAETEISEGVPGSLVSVRPCQESL
jgi:hypothetical protein